MPEVQVLLHLVEHGALRAGEELVPAGVQGLRTVGEQRVVGGGGDHVPRAVLLHRPRDALRRGDLEQVGGGTLGDQQHRRRLQYRRLHRVAGLLRGSGRAVEQVAALEADQVDVHAGRQLRLGVVQPGGPRVGPALDAERPRTLGVGAHPRLPRVEAARLDRGHVDALLASVGSGEDHRGVDRVVAFAEHLRANRDQFADDGLRRVRATLDDRADRADGDPAETGGDRRHRSEIEGWGRGGNGDGGGCGCRGRRCRSAHLGLRLALAGRVNGCAHGFNLANALSS